MAWTIIKKTLFKHPKLGKGIVYQHKYTDDSIKYSLLFFSPQYRNEAYGIRPEHHGDLKRIRRFPKKYADLILSESRRWVKPKK